MKKQAIDISKKLLKWTIKDWKKTKSNDLNDKFFIFNQIWSKKQIDKFNNFFKRKESFRGNNIKMENNKFIQKKNIEGPWLLFILIAGTPDRNKILA